jgi:AbrB family transcriptional regulator, transcriptional pleiotropic regulator of transition state genes
MKEKVATPSGVAGKLKGCCYMAGIVRRIDELGRLVLPIEYRKQLQLPERAPVEMSLQGDTIMVRHYGERCHFCESDKNVFPFKTYMICRDCGKEIHFASVETPVKDHRN